MARPTSSPPLALTVPRSHAASRITQRIEVGYALRDRSPESDESIEQFPIDCNSCNEYNVEMLRQMFTTDDIAQEYALSLGGFHTADKQELVRLWRRSIESGITKLKSLLARLELYREPDLTPTVSPEPLIEHGRSRVFVVHGHDEAALQAVARFLEHLRLDTIILREQPNQGRTIIEKFEDCASEVGFAVVLLTPDDIARANAAPQEGSRARQNVIFELGYFAGKLGRGRACLLRKGDVEIPSDLYGVIYTDMDAADGWKLKLVKELKAAALEFDANRMWG
jgi:predicted nucleotide-binding protein